MGWGLPDGRDVPVTSTDRGAVDDRRRFESHIGCNVEKGRLVVDKTVDARSAQLPLKARATFTHMAIRLEEE